MEEDDWLVSVSLLNSCNWCQSLIMLDGASPFFFFLRLRSDTKSSVLLLSHRHKGILVSWVMPFLLSLVFCDFSPAKWARFTNKLTDHTALGLREGARVHSGMLEVFWEGQERVFCLQKERRLITQAPDDKVDSDETVQQMRLWSVFEEILKKGLKKKWSGLGEE